MPSGNAMSFLMLIATEVNVQGAGQARVQLHIQRSKDNVVLLGTNALQALNIRIQLGEPIAELRTEDGNGECGGTVRAIHRHVIPAGGISTVPISGLKSGLDECIFWSTNDRISSGVLKATQGEALVSVRNSSQEPWVIRKGETLGKWDKGSVVNYLNEMVTLISEYEDVFAISDLELTQTDLLHHSIDVGDSLPIKQRTRPVPYALRSQRVCIITKIYEAATTITKMLHVDFICPGGLSIDGQRLPCSTNMTWHEISGMRNSPIDGLIFDCVFKLARVATIMSQTHTTSEMQMARILDAEYDALSPSGLGFAISFFSAKCLHVMQSMQTRYSTEHQFCVTHPSRTPGDPYDLPSLFDYACNWARAHPWTETLWKELPPKKTLVLLPCDFKEHIYSIQSHCQLVRVYAKPDDVKETWCQDEFSAVVLFSPSRAFPSAAWAQAWQLMLGMVSDGVELFILGTPRDKVQWPKAIDGLRDICEETVAQRPKLSARIKCLLMTKSEEHSTHHPCNVVENNSGSHPHTYSASEVKRFYEATRNFYIAHVRLTPYYSIRTKVGSGTKDGHPTRKCDGCEESHVKQRRLPQWSYRRKNRFRQANHLCVSHSSVAYGQNFKSNFRRYHNRDFNGQWNRSLRRNNPRG
ncbi:hypothetical protein OSTOST_16202 [Ostertagia ostertagi]